MVRVISLITDTVTHSSQHNHGNSPGDYVPVLWEMTLICYSLHPLFIVSVSVIVIIGTSDNPDRYFCNYFGKFGTGGGSKSKIKKPSYVYLDLNLHQTTLGVSPMQQPCSSTIWSIVWMSFLRLHTVVFVLSICCQMIPSLNLTTCF